MPDGTHHISKQVLDHFSVVGINYHKADAATRGLFSVHNEDFEAITEDARKANVKSLMVLSTCNRTEVYGIADHPQILGQILLKYVKGTKGQLEEYGYFKHGDSALNHIFNVAAGMDSQILGDYEILGQLKRAFDLSKSHNMIGPVMDRILNYVFQASKRIKTETSLSTGTVSVSFAAIELLQTEPDIDNKSVLLIGAGKFGTNIGKNIFTYLPKTKVAITNRTDETAIEFAQKHNISFVSFTEKHQAMDAADIIIVCTNANEPTVLKNDLSGNKRQLILDLSVPLNVSPDVASLPNIRVVNVDEISNTILDKTLARRKAELPKAISVINFYKKELQTWLREYHYTLHVKTWKNKLQEIDQMQAGFCEFYNDKELIHAAEKQIRTQNVVKQLAVNLKEKNDKGCQIINLLKEYLQTSVADVG
jgi:glutamyl-tRNA reductase